MKNFIKYDYYVQLFSLIVGIIFSILGFKSGGFIFFYFIIGIPQLISFLIKSFQKTKKSIVYIIYGVGIMPVWFSIIIILGLNQNNDITNFFGFILIAALIYSPVFAFLYMYESYKVYQSLKYTK